MDSALLSLTAAADAPADTWVDHVDAYTALLDVPVEWDRYCPTCEHERHFRAEKFCVRGLIARCSVCQEEIVARFTRTTAEVE